MSIKEHNKARNPDGFAAGSLGRYAPSFAHRASRNVKNQNFGAARKMYSNHHTVLPHAVLFSYEQNFLLSFVRVVHIDVSP